MCGYQYECVNVLLWMCVWERESLGSVSVFQKSMSPSQSSRWKTVRSQSHFVMHLPRLFGLVWRLFNRITDNSTCGDGAWTLFSLHLDINPRYALGNWLHQIVQQVFGLSGLPQYRQVMCNRYLEPFSIFETNSICIVRFLSCFSF